MHDVKTESPAAKFERLVVAHRELLLICFFGIAVPVCAFGWLAKSIHEKGEFLGDAAVLDYLYGSARPWLDRMMTAIARSGQIDVVVVLTVLCIVVLKGEHRLRDAFFVTLALGGVVVADLLVQTVVQRVRMAPWEAATPTFDSGSPSSQSADTLSVALVCAILTWTTRWRWWIITAGSCYVFAIGMSRVYLGLHYPSDIVAGWALSLAWVTVVSFVRHPNSRGEVPAARGGKGG